MFLERDRRKRKGYPLFPETRSVRFKRNGKPVPFRFTNTGSVGLRAKRQYFFFLSNRKKNQTRTTEAGQDFRRAFSFERHQKELTKIRGKKLPSFQEDMRKIPEMLSRQTIGFLFKRKGFRFRPVLLPTAIFLAILWLLSHIK